MNKHDYLEMGQYFDSWKIEKQIGEGANGTVYLISKKEMGWTFYAAMKVVSIPASEVESYSILAEGMTSEEMVSYYKSMVDEVVKEIITMSRLKGNTNIVSYEDHMVVERKNGIGWDIFIKMEYLTPLVSVLQDTLLDEAQIIKIGIDICKALELCSDIKIIHRDIKPENIYITQGGDYKLGDFGIAKTIDQTVVGLSRKGTLEYMAPEVFLKGKCNLTADIYSLGMVLYKLMNNNRTPFLPTYPNQIMYADREEAINKRFKGNKIEPPQNGDERLREIVLKACEYSPDDRYQSPTDMRLELEALQKVLGYQTTESLENARQTASTYAQTKLKTPGGSGFVRKSRVPAILALLLMVAVIAGFGYYNSLPKAITAIEGLEPETEMLLGEAVSPEYEVLPERFTDEVLTFESDSDCVRIDENGRIEAAGVGTAKVTVSARDYTYTAKITVKPKITSIDNVKDKISLVKGKSKVLHPVLYPEVYRDETVEYSIEDENVAKVSSKGKVTGLKPGKTLLHITAGGYTMEVQIIVKKPAPKVLEEPVYEPVYESVDEPENEPVSQPEDQQESEEKTKKKPSSQEKNEEKTPVEPMDEIGSFGDDEYFDE